MPGVDVYDEKFSESFASFRLFFSKNQCYEPIFAKLSLCSLSKRTQIFERKYFKYHDIGSYDLEGLKTFLNMVKNPFLVTLFHEITHFLKIEQYIKYDSLKE
jgi:hypothetical protein